jgi:hypothetical protein
MSRLPTPGSDDGNWGSVLNDFLLVGHNTDGTLKTTGLATESFVTAQTAGFATQAYVNGQITNRLVRVQTLANQATLTLDSTNYDCGSVAELSQNVTFANPSGTPADFQQYVLRIKTTTARTITWGAQFRGSAHTMLPGFTTGGGKTDYLAFRWNATGSKWDLLAYNQDF